MNEKITAFYDRHIVWKDGGTIFIGAHNPVPVVSLEQIKRIADNLTVKLKKSEKELPSSEQWYNLGIENYKRVLLSAAKKEAEK